VKGTKQKRSDVRSGVGEIAQRRPKGKAPIEWVPIAEERANNNGGVLEAPGWLVSNGFKALYLAMRKHADLFEHIRQTNHNKRPPEWVLIAEARAISNGGFLESHTWLARNGLAALCMAIKARPALFAHIPQENPQGHYKTPGEWVPIAEERAISSGGVLESPGWLARNGLAALCMAIKARPALFAHIPQERRGGGRSAILVAIRGGGEKGLAIASRLGVKHEE
jgi:hypothetical protein